MIRRSRTLYESIAVMPERGIKFLLKFGGNLPIRYTNKKPANGFTIGDCIPLSSAKIRPKN